MPTSTLVHIYTALSMLYADPIDYPNQPQLWCLTENVLYESSGESFAGQLAVLEVVHTRMLHDKYPNSYCEVIHQHKQFSWTLIEPEYRRKPSDWEIEKAAQLAYSFLEGKTEKTPVYGATHFINVNHADYTPSWYYKYEYLGKLGNHEFFRRPSYGETIAKTKLKTKPEKVIGELNVTR